MSDGASSIGEVPEAIRKALMAVYKGQASPARYRRLTVYNARIRPEMDFR